MNTRFLRVLAGICLLFLASCVKEPQPIAVTGVTLNSSSLELIEGETAVIVATVSPKDADNQAVIWSSSNGSIASVNNGIITAIKAGSTVITAKSDDGGYTASCAVTVVAKTIEVSSVSLSRTELKLTEGDSETLIATVKPDDATDKTIIWSSSDIGIVSVDESGKVTAIKEGAAIIIAIAGDKKAYCSVTVAKRVIEVESVILNKTELLLEKGKSETLLATVKPDDATNKTVTWSSSDDGIVSVDQAGIITAINGGEATITASASDKTATCVVTVLVPVESVSLDRTSITLEEEQSTILVATIKPGNATNLNLTWSSSNTNVASVNGGLVTAIKAGSSIISVITEDGQYTASCIVTVVPRAITLTYGFGEYWGQWYNANTDNYTIYLYNGVVDSNGSFIGSAQMLKLDILLPKTGEFKLRDGVYRCSYNTGETQIFIPTYESKDENGISYLDGSTLYIQSDSGQHNTCTITDGTVVVRTLVTGQYEIDATIVANGAEYTFHFKGAVNIEDKRQTGDNGFPGSDIYQLKAKALYNGEVYDGSDDYTLYLYYGEYLDNGDFKTVGTEMVFEILTKKTGEMVVTPGKYTCTGNDFTEGHFLEGLEEDGTTFPSYLYRQYDSMGNYSLEIVTGGDLTISKSVSEYQVRASFTTPSGSFLIEYKGPITITDKRYRGGSNISNNIEMKSISNSSPHGTDAPFNAVHNRRKVIGEGRKTAPVIPAHQFNQVMILKARFE